MTPPRVTLIVLAKSPRPGHVKTRLCPPCTPHQAARIAEAALVDTLEAVLHTPSVRPLLVLDGPLGAWIPSDFETIRQRGHGLDERITAAFAAAGGPALLVGMDTPQITPTQLENAVARLMSDGIDAVLGPSEDGGFWALGQCVPDPDLTLGVPMSTDRTGAVQHQRLVEYGQCVELLSVLRDVDTLDDALAVARIAPKTRFAAAVTELGRDSRELTPA